MNKKVSVKKRVRMEIMKGLPCGDGKGYWICVVIKGKKYVMREVEEFYWEK
jgi:hypothetical protein